MSVNDCRIIEFPKICDHRGNLTVIESERHVPFKVERVFYLYDVPSGTRRGGHAHRELYLVLVALAGSFEIVLDDGGERRTVRLDRPQQGLLIPPMIWHEMDNFSGGSVCMSIASAFYDESDYLRDYQEFCVAAGTAV